MKTKWMALLLLLPLAVSAAQAYKIMRPNGSVEFTDQSEQNAEEITLPGAQSYQSPAGASSSSQGTTTPPVQPASSDYQQFSISSPAAEQTLPHNGGNLSISVSIAPALQPGHQVVVTLDGSEAARGEATSFSLTNVARGAHQLGATLVDDSGSVLREASPVTFYTFQPSAIKPK